ncbi:hypothetical protein IAR55_005277 [Kwoniella newhampshirensis]|uniref:tRNA-splicing endonuclease subunit Sen15 domain-containing protein n=1 Tax=Kwoniella newhampshirensis TaxID=1651941 RepID=A0AAW0YLR9_9TREE
MSRPPAFLVPILERYPLQAGPLLTSLYDISLSVGWIDIRILQLEGWVVLLGHRRKEDPVRAVVPTPIHTTSLHPSSLKSIFSQLSRLDIENLPEIIPALAPTLDELRSRSNSKTNMGESHPDLSKDEKDDEAEAGENDRVVEKTSDSESRIDRETLYLAIVTPDSTVVYYKLSKGIKKPADVPDE